jgi:hypothetical protein
MTERETKFYEKLLLRRIETLLSHLPGHSHEILDVESGKEYLCSLCDMPMKPCAVHAGYLCCVALKGGTELFELEAALIRLQSGEYGFCVRCGKIIGKHRLQAYPATVLCERCFDMTSHPKSKSVAALRSRASHHATQRNSPSSFREKHRKE